MRPWILLAIVLAGCTPVAAGTSGRPLHGRVDHSADRVVVPQMARITGVAVTHRFAFVTSENAVATFDRLLDSWMPPVGEPEPWPSRRILGVAAHPLDDAAWIIEQGAIVHFEPTLGWSMRTTIVGSIDAVVFDRRDPQTGIFVRSLGSWTRVSATGAAMPVQTTDLPAPEDRLVPATLEDLMRERPSLRGYARLLTRDDAMRSWEPSAAAEAPEGGEIWLGTWGYGVFRVDPDFLRSVHEPYGLLEEGAGALALAADGIWIAGSGGRFAARNVPSALVFASPDLRDWEWRGVDGPGGTAIADARALVVRGRRAWVATGRGAVRVTLGGVAGARSIGMAHGLPSDDVLALAPRLDGLWLGTSRGLAFISDNWDDAGFGATPRAESPTLLPGVRVRALVSAGDTLWIGTDAGLYAMDSRSAAPRRVEGAAGGRLLRPILALATADTTVAVATADEVLLLDARTGAPFVVHAAANARSLGTVSAVELDARTLWIGGSRGLLVIDRGTGASRRLDVPRELPGPVLDLALTELFAWVATTDGLVRLRRHSDGSIR